LRSGFLKRENLPYHTPKGNKKKAARFISGAQAEFICIVGPWMMAFQDALKGSWNHKHFITFVSGLSNDDMGKIANDYYRKGLTTFEDDISVFDSSVCSFLLHLEYRIFKYFGAPKAVLALVRNNIKTKGRTKNGFMYRVPGTRKSGDPYTSCGNSMLNGLMHYFGYKRQLNLSTLQVTRQLRMMVQGDDNYGASKQRVDFRKIMLQFGFDSEAKYHDHPFKAEFCSMILYPVSNHSGVEVWVFGPKPGKLLSKFAYFVDPPPLVDTRALLRGVALGLEQTCHFIPPIKVYIDVVLKHTSGIKAELPSYSNSFSFSRPDFAFFTRHRYTPTPHTYLVLYERYKYLTTDDDIIRRLIDVEPYCLISHPSLDFMFDIDTSGPKVWFG
jgi:hypothetical protein